MVGSWLLTQSCSHGSNASAPYAASVLRGTALTRAVSRKLNARTSSSQHAAELDVYVSPLSMEEHGGERSRPSAKHLLGATIVAVHDPAARRLTSMVLQSSRRMKSRAACAEEPSAEAKRLAAQAR